MKILVTGGAGFIGSHIVDAYIAAGHDVSIIDDLSTGRECNVNKGTRFYRADICSDEALDIVANERPEIINHHAAQIDVRTSVANPVNDVGVNVLPLIRLVEAGVKKGLKKVIFASSGGTVYGEQDYFPVGENHPTRPLSPYGLNKLMCEKYLYYYRQVYGIQYVSLRYGNVYGPRQNPHGEAGVVAIFINKMLEGKQPIINGDGKQTRDYVYVEDVVSANIVALEDGGDGEYNVGTGVETDVNTIFRTLRKTVNIPVDEVHGPAKSGEQARSSISSLRLGRELGWKTTISFPVGISKTVEWFKVNRKW